MASRRTLALALCIALAGCATVPVDRIQGMAPLDRSAVAGASVDAFTAGTFTSPEGVVLPYRLLAPATLEPHLVAQYLRELANAFHGWYHASPVLVEDAALRNARLSLALATRQVLANGLDLLGVSAPESM